MEVSGFLAWNMSGFDALVEGPSSSFDFFYFSYPILPLRQ